MNANEIEKALDLNIEGKTREGHSRTTFFGSQNGKEVVIKHSENIKVPRELEALKLMENVGIPTPEILDFEKKNGDHILVTEKIESNFPERQMWKDYEFCVDFVESGAEILNKIHSVEVKKNSKPDREIFRKENRIEEDLSSKMNKIRKMYDEEIPEIIETITEKLHSTQGFAHGDFTTENVLIKDDTIVGVIDWADSGIRSKTRDVALFESSYIDEYIRIFHPEKVEELREKFRSKVEFDTEEKLELYRFHQNVVALAYIRSGGCSHEWQKLGSIEEIEEHREVLIQQDIGQVKEILEKL